MENTNTISDNSNPVTWQCQHCYRWYSKHNKHKLHLTKCIVYQNKCNTEYDVMLQMKDEVKHECVKLFQHMMLDFKMNIPAPAPAPPTAPIERKTYTVYLPNRHQDTP